MKNRAGSYKKLLFNEVQLSPLAKVLGPVFNTLKNDYELQKLSPQDFTTLYLLFYLREKYQTNYIQFHQKNFEQFSGPSVLDLISKYITPNQFEKNKLSLIDSKQLFKISHLKGIPQSVNRCMINWYLEKWQIVLMFKIPSSNTLLKFQAKNKRVLTIIVDESKLGSLILGKRDPLSFVIHDLMHADQFFNNLISQKGQLGFYKMIDDTPFSSELLDQLKSNPEFKESFEYVISDMNAYIIHLLKSFKSCFTRINRDDLFYQFLSLANIPKNLLPILAKINHEILNEYEESLICNFFENNQEYI